MKSLNNDVFFNMLNEPVFAGANLPDWQTAYIARDLRQKKEISLNCKEEEANSLFNKLNLFSGKCKIKRKEINNKSIGEIFVEFSSGS